MGGSEARALLPLRRDEKRMSWNVNGCDRSSLVQNVFGPQKTLERKRWRAAGEPGRSDGERGRTPERVAVPGGACPQTHRHHCHHRVSAGAVTSRSSWLRGGRQHAGERLSAPPPSDRKVRVLAVVSLTHSGVGFFAVGGEAVGVRPMLLSPLLLQAEAPHTPLPLPGSQN